MTKTICILVAAIAWVSVVVFAYQGAMSAVIEAEQKSLRESFAKANCRIESEAYSRILERRNEPRL